MLLLVALITALVVIAGTWLMGATVPSAPFVMGGLGWLAFAVFWGNVFLRKGSGSNHSSQHSDAGYLKMFWPWWLLIVLMGVALFNPIEITYSGHPGVERDWEPAEFSKFSPATFDSDASLAWLVFLSGMFALCITLYRALVQIGLLKYLLHGLLLNAVIVCLVGSYFRLSKHPLILGIQEPMHASYFGPFVYHNHYIGFVLLSLAIAMGLCFERVALYIKKRELRDLQPLLIYGAIIFLLVVTVPLARSRSGVLLVGVECLIFFSWLVMRFVLWRRRRGYRVLTLPVIGIGVGMLLLALTVGALGYTLGKAQIEARLESTREQLQKIAEGKMPDLRYYAARDTVSMGNSAPVFGVGLGAWRAAFPYYAKSEFYEDRFQMETKYYGKLLWLENAHNDWLQYWASLGTVGFILLLWVPVRLFLEIRRKGHFGAIGLSLLIGGGCVLLLALWDSPLTNFAVMAYFMILFTITMRYARLKGSMNHHLSKHAYRRRRRAEREDEAATAG